MLRIRWARVVAGFAFVVFGLMWGNTVSAQQMSGVWNLQGQVANVSSNPTIDYENRDLFYGDQQIPVQQIGSQLFANDVDMQGNPFTIQGQINGFNVTFTVSGLGLNPGYSPATTTYQGCTDGQTIFGTFSGSATGVFQDSAGQPVQSTVSWTGRFSVMLNAQGAFDGTVGTPVFLIDRLRQISTQSGLSSSTASHLDAELEHARDFLTRNGIQPDANDRTSAFNKLGALENYINSNSELTQAAAIRCVLLAGNELVRLMLDMTVDDTPADQQEILAFLYFAKTFFDDEEDADEITAQVNKDLQKALDQCILRYQHGDATGGTGKLVVLGSLVVDLKNAGEFPIDCPVSDWVHDCYLTFEANLSECANDDVWKEQVLKIYKACVAGCAAPRGE